MAVTSQPSVGASTPLDSRSTPARLPLDSSRRRLARARRAIKQGWQLYAMLALPVLWLLVFRYLPMYGAQIAFRDYNVVEGLAGSPSVGLEHVRRVVESYYFWPILRNTLQLNLYQLAAGFPLPILFALALNSIARARFRRTVQLVTYAPHFIPMVAMVGIILQLLAPAGLFNQLLGAIGIGPIHFMGEPAYWKSIYVWSGVWQNLGFNCIVFLAALTTIDPTLHEAATIDGAGKLRRIRDIDLPGIVPVAMILLILNLGFLLSTGFEKVLLLQNPLNLHTSEVIDTYVYRIGLESQFPNFSAAAAIGLFKSVVGLILIVAANQLARRLKTASLW